eukprot:CAMPEP_0177713338 /NCGR_PEP_ID=MMETSP0484_2-20121128/12884_1 /TAXON_ID=354590 /ORGANISM="Rhodomonas lens, Strain RHODO" /LENGTH=283 /DNA_ID=CAMNT_0019225217 /DNA_START=91 /DNA_END=939 /DNA_ORIENTATION=-
MGLGESDTEIEKEQSEAVICGDRGSDDDDGILFQQDSEDGTRIEIPCSVAHFFHATFECESYTPVQFSMQLSALGPERARLGPDVWCTFSGMDIVQTSRFVEALRVLEGIALTPANFLHSDSHPKRLQTTPPASVLCQLIAMAKAWRIRITLDSSFRSAPEAVCSYFDLAADAFHTSAQDFAALLSVTEVLPRVFHVHTASRLVLASTFVRFQEHYEGQSVRFRRQSFSLEEFRKWYREGEKKDGEGSTPNLLRKTCHFQFPAGMPSAFGRTRRTLSGRAVST